MSRSQLHELFHAVWSHTVHIEFRNKGWPVLQEEYDEAVACFRNAEARGFRIPSIAETCDYFSHG